MHHSSALYSINMHSKNMSVRIFNLKMEKQRVPEGHCDKWGCDHSSDAILGLISPSA